MKIENRWLDVPVAGEPEPMSAYLAQPTEPGPRATVLVGFELFGVTDYVCAVADRVAALGYTAVVPDFYHRSGRRIALPTTADGRTRGFELLSEVTRDGVDRDIEALLDQLPGPHAMVGLSVGGHIAYYAAARFPFAAVATFYPGWLTDATIPLGRPTPTLDLTPGIKGRLLFLVGDGDNLFTPAQRDEIAARLRDDGIDHDFVVYPDTPHGFFCDERDSYRPAEAADAFSRVTSMLADHLG